MQTLDVMDVEQQKPIIGFLERLPNSALIASWFGCLFAVMLALSIGYNYQQFTTINAKVATVAKLKKDIGEKDALIERLEADQQHILSNGNPVSLPEQDLATIDDILAADERSTAEHKKVPEIAPSLEGSKGSTTSLVNKTDDHPSPKIVNGECQLTTNAINKDPSVIIGCVRMMNDNDPLAPQQRGKIKLGVVPG